MEKETVGREMTFDRFREAVAVMGPPPPKVIIVGDYDRSATHLVEVLKKNSVPVVIVTDAVSRRYQQQTLRDMVKTLTLIKPTSAPTNRASRRRQSKKRK